MLRKLVAVAVVLGLIGLAGFWFLTMPRGLSEADLPNHTADLANGERMFWAGGCESCHAAPDARGDELFVLTGGEPLVSPFGTFHAPNISPDPNDGIGDWSLLEFVNAMKYGIGKGGTHLYPAFPYTSYQRMTLTDIIDLKAFLDTLPAVAGQAPPHELPFPFNIRRGLGLWQLLYVDGKTYTPDPALDEATNLGGYLVRGPGHCGECHTPRNAIGGPDDARYLAGGPSPDGSGPIPNITPHDDAIGWWTEDDMVAMFANGITPTFEGVEGSMAPVQRNMAKLSADDQRAMARYLKTVAAVATPTASE